MRTEAMLKGSAKTAPERNSGTTRRTLAGKVIFHLKRDRLLYLMLIPVLAYYVIFVYKPMGGLVIAFQDYSLFKGIRGSEWVWFENFERFFQSPYFFRNLKNTIMMNLTQTLIAFPAPIILALMLNEVKSYGYKRIIQTLTYLPYFVSVVVVAGIVTNFLAPTNGLINIILDKLGFEKVYFLTLPEMFRPVYILSFDIWQNIGIGAIIYIAALAGINPELYEAASIDGAGRWRKIWSISLPGILPTVLVLLLLNISNFIEVGHEAIILLYQPVTYETADVFSTYAYRTGLSQGNYDLGAAVGLFTNTVGFVLVVIANWISRRFAGNGLW
ncbi:ABC transporter permease [Paenibacillus montanisoli]|nr:ABC transporter permease subunit [Paenibacillus montanisoli]